MYTCLNHLSGQSNQTHISQPKVHSTPIELLTSPRSCSFNKESPISLVTNIQLKSSSSLILTRKITSTNYFTQISTHIITIMNQSNSRSKFDHSLSYITHSFKSEMINKFTWNDRILILRYQNTKSIYIDIRDIFDPSSLKYSTLP